MASLPARTGKKQFVYDYYTNSHHTLKKNPLKFDDLKEFIECYNPTNGHQRKKPGPDRARDGRTGPEGGGRKFSYKIIARDKTSLDITWLEDKSLADPDNLPDSDERPEEIGETI